MPNILYGTHFSVTLISIYSTRARGWIINLIHSIVIDFNVINIAHEKAKHKVLAILFL